MDQVVIIEALKQSGGPLSLALVLVIYAVSVTIGQRPNGKLTKALDEMERRIGGRIDGLTERVARLEACNEVEAKAAEQANLAQAVAAAVRTELAKGKR